MKNFFDKKLSTAFIILSMFTMPILEIIGAFNNRKFFLQQESLVIIGILGFFILFFYFIHFIINFKKYKKSFVLSDFLIILSILFCIISILFSKNIEKSLFGEYAYSETPLQVLAYFSLFFICTLISNNANKKTLLTSFILLAIFESLVAFLQNFSIWPVSSLFDASWHTKKHMAFGLTEHCNFFAAVSIIFTGICAGKYIYETNKQKSYIFLVLSISTCLSTLFTYTRIGWVGILSVVFGLFFIEFCLYKSKKDKITFKTHLKKILILTLCFLTCFLIVGILSGQLLEDIFNSAKELSSEFENFGSKRGTIWKVGLSSLKKYPFTGVGFDNYRYSFEIYPEKFGWSQNKGHNEYIHTLVTQGIFSGINYLAFAFYCCYFPFMKILKGDTEFGKSDLTKIFLIALFAYFVQALFNSSVTNVAPYKWILMGLLLPRSEQKNLFDIKLFEKNKKHINN